MNKKNYMKPEMKAYPVHRTNVIATSGESAQPTNATEQYEKKNVNSIWF